MSMAYGHGHAQRRSGRQVIIGHSHIGRRDRPAKLGAEHLGQQPDRVRPWPFPAQPPVN